MPADDPDSPSPISGTCLCGAVRFEVHGRPRELLHCHCGMCRKAHGAAYATFVIVRHADFAFTAGSDRVVTYRSSAGAVRTFCGTCGSALQFVRDARDTFGLAVAAIDTPLEALPERQYHSAERVPWRLGKA